MEARNREKATQLLRPVVLAAQDGGAGKHAVNHSAPDGAARWWSAAVAGGRGSRSSREAKMTFFAGIDGERGTVDWNPFIKVPRSIVSLLTQPVACVGNKGLTRIPQ